MSGSGRESFTVTLPGGFSRLMLGGSLLFALFPVAFALAGDLPPLGVFMFALIIASLPLAAVAGRRFRVRVRDGVVTVRPALFGSEWDFVAADVTRVVRRINYNTGMGTLAKMTVHARGRRVSVESLMVGSEGFWAFIEGNVDPSRIVTKVNRRGGTHEGR